MTDDSENDCSPVTADDGGSVGRPVEDHDRSVPALLPAVDARDSCGVQVVLGPELSGPSVQHNYYGPVSFGASSEAAADASTASALAPGQSPYPGMVAFEAWDASLFYGRERATVELVRQVERLYSRGGLSFLVGASGSGKSSLLRAGLIPALQAGELAVEGSQDWPVLLLTPGPKPVRMLATGIATLAGLPAGEVLDDLLAHPDGFDLLVRQALLGHDVRRAREPADGAPSVVSLVQSGLGRNPGGSRTRRLVLVIDQFEEVFSPDVDEPDRRIFIQALAAAARPLATSENLAAGGGDVEAAALVVLGLRADFFAQCVNDSALRPHLADHQVLVGPLTEDEVRAAIERPAHDAGLRLEPGLVELLLTDLHLRHEPGGQEGPVLTAAAGGLAFLAHALRQTWERREGDALTVAGYRAAGGVYGSVAATAEHLYEGMDEVHRIVMRQVMLRLVTITDGNEPTRRHATRAELVPEQDPARVARVLDRLVASRLVTAHQEWFAISHEALIGGWPRLTGWLEQDRAGLYLHRQLTEAARHWQHAGRDAGSLYRGARLDATQQWTREPGHRSDLNALEHEFLAASSRADTRRTRIRRGGIAALLVLLVAALTATTAAMVYASNARRQHLLAVSHQLATQSDALSASDPAAALQLAVAAWRFAPTAEARYSALNLLARPRHALLGHTGEVNGAAFSPDGRIVATASEDGTVRLWDTNTHRRIADLGTPDPGGQSRGSQDPGSTWWPVVFSPDGRLVAAAGSGVQFWDVATHQPVGQPLLMNSGINGLAFSPDGKTFATGGSDGTVRLWNVADHRALGPPLPGHSAAVHGVSFSPDGQILAAAEDEGVRLWDIATHRPVRRPLSGNTDRANGVAFSPNGKTLAAAGEDGKTGLWDVGTGRSLGPLTGHTAAVYGVAFSPDGKTLATASADKTARLWDVPSHDRLGPPLSTHTDTVNAVAFSPDGKSLVTTSNDRTVLLWREPTLQQVATPLSDPPEIAGRRSICDVVLGPDRNTLAITAQDGTVRLWDARTHRQRALLPAPAHRSRSEWVPCGEVVFSPDGRTLATNTGDQDPPFTGRGTVQLWDLTTDPPLPALLPGSAYSVCRMAFSPDGKTLATTSDFPTGQRMQLWDVATTHLNEVLPAVDASALSMSSPCSTNITFSPDGKTLALPGGTGVRFWHVPTHRYLGPPLAGLSEPDALAFSPDGKTLASTGGGSARLWDVASHHQLGQPMGYPDSEARPMFSPDGRTIAIVVPDGSVRILDVATRRQLGQPLTIPGDVASAAFSPDGRTLTLLSGEGAVWSWQVEAPADPTSAACAALDRSMTPEELGRYLPDEPYRQTCPA